MLTKLEISSMLNPNIFSKIRNLNRTYSEGGNLFVKLSWNAILTLINNKDFLKNELDFLTSEAKIE